MKHIYIILFTLFTINSFTQNRMYINAKSGLVIRDKPSLRSNKIYHLPNNCAVIVLKKTGISSIIFDEGKQIKGEWIQVRSFDNKNIEGYVFGGFLTSEQPEIWYYEKNAYYKTYSYENQQEGTYKPNSTSKKYTNLKLPIINPNIEYLNSKKFPYYLNPKNKDIVLFENHQSKNLKPIGILKNLTQVNIDSTFYKFHFKDLTNCVWNRININGKYYYIDVDIHDFSFSKNLKYFKQNVEIVGQNDGYDGNYHIGYPEYFFLIFYDDKNKVIHKTKVIDFILNDEFAMEEDILELKWNDKNKSYEIILIGHNNKIKIEWNGKTSKIKKL